MVPEPTIVPLPFTEKILLISGGGGHVLVYTTLKKKIFGCGWNNKGQLGMGDTEDRSTFEEIQLILEDDEEVLQLSCGWDTSAILTSQRLFVFGCNNFYQLGLEDTKVNILLPKEIKLTGDKVPLEVQMAMRQIVIRTKDSILISGKSQVVKDIQSQGVKDTKRPFVQIKPDLEVSQISAGQHHIIYITPENNQVVGLGQNKFNQSEDQKFSTDVLQIKSGWTHNACLLDSGDVHVWGRNIYGQLGNGQTSHSSVAPLKLVIPEKTIEEVHLGSEHGLVQTSDGCVYTWGWNEHGNCGNGSEENVLVPEKIELQDTVVKACCGAGFCFVVTEKNG